MKAHLGGDLRKHQKQIGKSERGKEGRTGKSELMKDYPVGNWTLYQWGASERLCRKHLRSAERQGNRVLLASPFLTLSD